MIGFNAIFSPEDIHNINHIIKNENLYKLDVAFFCYLTLLYVEAA